MGKFTTIKELENNHVWDWYCPNHHAIQNNRSEVFRYECSIHRSKIEQNYDGTNRLKIQIRQFIEHELQDTVVMDYMNLTYYYEPPSDTRYNTYGYQISHGYYRFFFESEASQVMFALKFSEFLSTKYRWKDDQFPRGQHTNHIWDPEVEDLWRQV